MKSITDGGTDEIQNQIIDITASHQSEQLNDFYSSDEYCGSKEDPGQGSEPAKDLRQKKSQRDEHDDVAAQVDDGGADIFRTCRIQQARKKPQRPEGDQIQLRCHLIPVGDSGIVAGPVEEEPEHDCAIGKKQRGMQFLLVHGSTSLWFGEL